MRQWVLLGACTGNKTQVTVLTVARRIAQNHAAPTREINPHCLPGGVGFFSVGKYPSRVKPHCQEPLACYSSSACSTSIFAS